MAPDPNGLEASVREANKQTSGGRHAQNNLSSSSLPPSNRNCSAATSSAAQKYKRSAAIHFSNAMKPCLLCCLPPLLLRNYQHSVTVRPNILCSRTNNATAMLLTSSVPLKPTWICGAANNLCCYESISKTRQ
jgi:hypothetical protein